MSFHNAKVYFDGSHYIAIPHTERKLGKKKRSKGLKEKKEKEKFEEAYAETKGKRKCEKVKEIKDKISVNFEDEAMADDFIRVNMDRKERNAISRKVRLVRKVYNNEWNYFCTFTYDQSKHTEETFKKKLSNCLKHLSSRKDWRYIGVWERSPNKQRLHFHGLFYIPEMIGELQEIRDYDTKNHRMQITLQNTHFNKTFGRSDFKKIERKEILGDSIAYLMKYLDKSGERIVYSRNIPTYYVTDILDEDIVCNLGDDDPRLILADNFSGFNEGCYVGEICTETKRKLKTAN